MKRKENLDAFGVTMLSIFTLILALNQVVIKLSNGGLQPVFGAAVRSVGALLILLIWMWFRGMRPKWPTRGVAISGILSGCLFTGEFICLYWALDLTTVSRTTIIFYTMPVFLAMALHFFMPSERLTGAKILGLALALGGVVWVLFDRSNGAGNLIGDIAALCAAIFWAGIVLFVRLSPLAGEKSEVQLMWQLIVSSILLMVVAPFFGPLIRDLTVIHLYGMAFQILAIASFGYLGWFALIKIYPATSVASFSFLTPVVSVAFGWAILGEEIGTEVLGGLALVVVGLMLINRPKSSK